MNKQRKQKQTKGRPARLMVSMPPALPNFNQIIEAKKVVVLRYTDPFYVRNNVGANYLAYYFKANSAYDLDNLVLSGNAGGFKEYSQFYRQYRVLTVGVRIHISNQEPFPVMWGFFFTPNNPITYITSRDTAIAALENPCSTRTNLLSAKGGQDRQFIERSQELAALLGDRTQYMSPNYAGLTSADPATLLYFSIVVASPNATNLSNGVVTGLTFELEVEFFDRLPIIAV